MLPRRESCPAHPDSLTIRAEVHQRDACRRELPLRTAIRAHIDRLEKDGLMTDELRQLLRSGVE